MAVSASVFYSAWKNFRGFLGFNRAGQFLATELMMKQRLWMGTLFLAGAGTLVAQQASQNPYQGTSNPPIDDRITTYQEEPAAKPAPGRLLSAQPAGAAQETAGPTSAESQAVVNQTDAANVQNPRNEAGDDGIVMLESDKGSQPTLNQRQPGSDPDGDIVHPESALPLGTLAYGTTIRARLLDRLSTAYNNQGDKFRATVASDVLQGGEVLIPAGSEIEGSVAQVSTGHFAGHGSILLRPQTVTLSNGSKFQLFAEVDSTPGSNTRVGSEGEVGPGSQLKKNSIWYGGGVGAGMIAGAAMGGPAGMLAGSLVGAGAVTVHLLTSHPQATLDEGTVLVFSLTRPLHLRADTGDEGGQRPAGQE
jgi:hypothetical protein